MTNRYVPGSSLVLEAIQALRLQSAPDFISTIKEIQPSSLRGTFRGEGYFSALGFLSDYLRASDQIARLNQELEDSRLEILRHYLNQGSWVLKEEESGKQLHKGSSYYDFTASLKLRELDQKGILPFVESAKAGKYGMEIGEEIYRSTATQTIQDIANVLKVNPEVTAYLLGVSNLSFVDLSEEQLREVEKVLNWLDISNDSDFKSAGSEMLIDYLNQTYEYKAGKGE